MTEQQFDEWCREVDQKVFEAHFKTLVYRDALAAVLGYVAAQQDHPDSFLKVVGALAANRASKISGDDDLSVEASTIVQAESDWLVASAKAVLISLQR
jgi:hypothetical protein